jgi:hypothetical protein
MQIKDMQLARRLRGDVMLEQERSAVNNGGNAHVSMANMGKVNSGPIFAYSRLDGS